MREVPVLCSFGCLKNKRLHISERLGERLHIAPGGSTYCQGRRSGSTGRFQGDLLLVVLLVFAVLAMCTSDVTLCHRASRPTDSCAHSQPPHHPLTSSPIKGLTQWMSSHHYPTVAPTPGSDIRYKCIMFIC